MWPRVANQRLFTSLLFALIALAWLALWVWGQSPYGRFLSHEEIGAIEIHAGGDALFLAVVSVAGWTLMTVAMMLPTSLPLIGLFQAMTRQRQDGTWLVVLLIAGYLSTWALFGAVAHAGDRVLHGLVEQSARLEANAWVLGSGTFLLAGLYQFTPLKYKCLDQCRSPLSFIMGHWQGRGEARQAFRLGLDHGLFCVGCCWSLMLLMFAVAVGNLGWMLALGAVMATEKNMPWGRRLSAPLGGALVVAGLALVLLKALEVAGVG